LGNIECGFLVNPNDLNEVVNRIEDYIDNKSLLINHSKNGRTEIENGKNWEIESIKLLNLIEILLK
jgi:glycosyltransferase involved in cell wall biosynthesis